jgi:hypothetical protein
MVGEIFGPVLTAFVYDDSALEETLDLGRPLWMAGSTTGALMPPGYGRYQITTSCHTSQQRGLQVLHHCGTEYYKTMYAATFYYTKAPNPLLIVY